MSRVFSRRKLLGTAALGAAGLVFGRKLLSEAGEGMSKWSAGGIGSNELPASTEIVNAGNLKQSFEQLGQYVYLTPQKLGGGTHAVDLNSGRTLAWISYWNYGDSCPAH